jgi:predicted  nucleic acid-binding Zn-ribbon protein
VEDKALEIMERVSAVEVGMASLSSELGKLEGEWHREQERLLAAAGRHQAAIADLRQKRQQLAAGIDPAAVGLYNEAQRKGRAVARVEQGTCRGCGITLSTAQLQQAKGDRLVRCGSCGRILFFA